MNQWPGERCWCRRGIEDASDGHPGGWQAGPENCRLGTHTPLSTPPPAQLRPTPTPPEALLTYQMLKAVATGFTRQPAPTQWK